MQPTAGPRPRGVKSVSQRNVQRPTGERNRKDIAGHDIKDIAWMMGSFIFASVCMCKAGGYHNLSEYEQATIDYLEVKKKALFVLAGVGFFAALVIRVNMSLKFEEAFKKQEENSKSFSAPSNC